MFREELEREAVEKGRECLVVVADYFTPGPDPIDFFYWRVVNHLLSRTDAGARTLRVLSDRLTARLLSEALRQLPQNEQVELIPARGLVERISLWFRSRRSVRKRLDAIRELIGRCDVSQPTQLREACGRIGLQARVAHQVILDYLERTEPKDVLGTLRRDLYSRLTMLSLTEEREPLDDYLTEDYLQAPPHVTGAGHLSSRLLRLFLELFQALAIPAILVFDQLEDFISVTATGQRAAEERQRDVRDAFCKALASLVNNVPGLCILVFAEKGLWDRTMLGMEAFTQPRLLQGFHLPGRPSQREISMPDRFSQAVIEKLIERRITVALSGLDITGLPTIFPFEEKHLQDLSEETRIRECIRKLGDMFDKIVFNTPPPPFPPPLPPVGEVVKPLMDRLRARWNKEMAGARKTLEKEDPGRVFLIPEIQGALDYWLSYLHQHGLTGSCPWAKVELFQDESKGPFGYLNIIRLDDENSPGLGIAAWMSEGARRPNELRHRLGFFDLEDCPIRTLVLFRRDGLAACRGATKIIYDDAIEQGYDLRMQEYEPDDLAGLLAFKPWLQAVKDDDKLSSSDGVATLRTFVEERARKLLGWIDSWRQLRIEGKK
jgi:hypothetical protein